MKPKVFISRNLASDSRFKLILEAAEWDIEGYSFLQFEAMPFEYDPDVDWLFFYSPRGVQFFFKKEPEILDYTRIAVMGAGTEKALKKVGRKAHFIGSGSPEEIAKQFEHILEGKEKICFVQAQQSRQSVGKNLPEGFRKTDLVVYQNRENEQQKLPEADVLVFTSPMNFQAYWNRLKKQKTAGKPLQYLAIGPSTQTFMEKRLKQAVPCPDIPSLEKLAQLVLNY